MYEQAQLKISRWLWRRLIIELHLRGQNRRESGAFLLGSQNGSNACVSEFICYEDLDPNALDLGYVTLHSQGLKALWAECRTRRLDVVADVHTHPGPDTRQSDLDQRHPMIPIDGHVALIVPNFGNTTKWSLSGVGIHEYRNASWLHHAPPQSRVKLRWWS